MSAGAFAEAAALIVGIAAYRQVARLPAVRDAPALAALLHDPALAGYPPERVTLLLDEQATLAALRAALAALAAGVTPASTVLLYFSGHGARIVDGPYAGNYLLPVDADAGDDASLAATALAGAELSATLVGLAARQVVVIFDCCHAGGLGQPRATGRHLAVAGLAERYYDELRVGRGRVILAAARENEFAYVRDGAEYGLFTGHLLDGLRGGAADADGLVRIFDLFEYLQPRVTAAQPNQHPVFKAELESNFAIARAPLTARPPAAALPNPGGSAGGVAGSDDGYRFDAYISYVDREPDSGWVWQWLLPRLTAAGLRVAVSNDSLEPGVARIVGIERAIHQARRTVVVLSPAALADHLAEFERVVAQSMDAVEGTYRLLPVQSGELDERQLPPRLRMLTRLNLVHPTRRERELQRLIGALRSALPR